MFPVKGPPYPTCLGCSGLVDYELVFGAFELFLNDFVVLLLAARWESFRTGLAGWLMRQDAVRSSISFTCGHRHSKFRNPELWPSGSATFCISFGEHPRRLLIITFMRVEVGELQTILKVGAAGASLPQNPAMAEIPILPLLLA